MASEDTIVLGAGIIGASCAWRLAQSGRTVVLIDDEGLSPASTVAAGMLAPVTEAEFGEEELLGLNIASSAMYPRFVEELAAAGDMDLGYRRCGTLMVARDHDDRRALDDVYQHQRRLGLDARRLSATEVRALEPSLSPRTRGGISVPGDHQIDPAAVVAALATAGARAGVERVAGRVVEVVPDKDGVTVNMTSGDVRRCASVVLAAGSYSGTITGWDGGTLPVRPVKGQLVHLQARGLVPLPGCNIRGLDVYIVARADGRVVVGATVEEQGFDKTPTAGAVHDLLRYAHELWPGVVELEFCGVTAGLRPATPDNAPMIGFLTDRVVVATGHYRNGILLAPLTAGAVVDLIEGRVPELLEPFSPLRFRARETAAR